MRRDAVDGLSRVLSVRSREGAGGWGLGGARALPRSLSLSCFWDFFGDRASSSEVSREKANLIFNNIPGKLFLG